MIIKQGTRRETERAPNTQEKRGPETFILRVTLKRQGTTLIESDPQSLSARRLVGSKTRRPQKHDDAVSRYGWPAGEPSSHLDRSGKHPPRSLANRLAERKIAFFGRCCSSSYQRAAHVTQRCTQTRGCPDKRSFNYNRRLAAPGYKRFENTHESPPMIRRAGGEGEGGCCVAWILRDGKLDGIDFARAAAITEASPSCRATYLTRNKRFYVTGAHNADTINIQYVEPRAPRVESVSRLKISTEKSGRKRARDWTTFRDTTDRRSRVERYIGETGAS